ncbi:hypothetical protein J2S43_002316 [Catenuloplanes nepalensis]|uniref:von Hippel-Lindau disease tumour suppressor beta domain-containing protein n=1 Tax=Catenuloplanes nepalensis TaxID=587533 RepID=A0ABT9MQY3_9ACTN|nr:hypothetical protein [Catenuloplanes nepalensis]MDP9793804.1 hypothetical protein [Catenuloplanes nepalensis]
MTNQTDDSFGGPAGTRGRGALFHAVLAAAAVLITAAAAVAVVFVTRDGGARDDARPAPPASATPDASSAPAPAGAWPVLTALPADTEPTGPISGTRTRISFENHTTDVYAISWLDPDGVLTEYATLDPGATYVQNTYAGHYWAAGISGKEITAVFLAAEEPGRAVLE